MAYENLQKKHGVTEAERMSNRWKGLSGVIGKAELDNSGKFVSLSIEAPPGSGHSVGGKENYVD